MQLQYGMLGECSKLLLMHIAVVLVLIHGGAVYIAVTVHGTIPHHVVLSSMSYNYQHAFCPYTAYSSPHKLRCCNVAYSMCSFCLNPILVGVLVPRERTR